MTLKVRPTGLGSGFYKDNQWIAASGASAASMRPALAPSLCAGSGRCTLPASQKACPANQVATLEVAKAELGELEAVEGVGGVGRNDPMNRCGV
jgi:hypothetical protein